MYYLISAFCRAVPLKATTLRGINGSEERATPVARLHFMFIPGCGSPSVDMVKVAPFLLPSWWGQGAQPFLQYAAKEKTMKIIYWAIALGLVISAVNTWAANSEKPKMEMRAYGEYLKPKFDDFWDKAYGGGIQGVMWVNADFALAAGLGIQSWKVNEEIFGQRSGYASGLGVGEAHQIVGDATMVSLGASGMYDIPLGEKAKIRLEGGIRYVVISPSIDYEYAIAVTDGRYVYWEEYQYEVDIDNGFVGFIGADFDYDMGSGWRIFAGGGYQFDISKGDISAESLNIGENELAGAFIRGGVSRSF